MKYPKLIGLCKDCLYKCYRCEDYNFIGVKECKYYEREVQNSDKFKKETEQQEKENGQNIAQRKDINAGEQLNIVGILAKRQM